MIDRQELRRIAEAERDRQEEPWAAYNDSDNPRRGHWLVLDANEICVCEVGNDEPGAAHIAAFSPRVVLELLDALDMKDAAIAGGAAGEDLRHVVANALNTNLAAVGTFLPPTILDGIADQLVKIVAAVQRARPSITRAAEHEQNSVLIDQVSHAMLVAVDNLVGYGAPASSPPVRNAVDVLEKVIPALRGRLP